MDKETEKLMKDELKANRARDLFVVTCTAVVLILLAIGFILKG